jgi:hypothetical protein
VAAGADTGLLDAALVRVSGTVADTARVAGDFRVRIDDGSGLLEVLLDQDSNFQFSLYSPGLVLDVAGLLVPISGTSSWRLKPRQAADVTVR